MINKLTKNQVLTSETSILIFCWWQHKLTHMLEKFQKFLRKLNVYLPYGPAINSQLTTEVK
jgi:hypothetical protein